MYNIIPLIIILISLSIIVFIVVKKFPAFSSVDVTSIKAEKEAKFKERIISNRLKRNIMKWYTKILKIIRPAGRSMSSFLKWLFNKSMELKNRYKDEPIMPFSNIKSRIENLFREADELKQRGELEKVEKKLIEIVGLDSKNIKAFKTLGELYFERKDYEEARQTFAHILKLSKSQEVYDSISSLSDASEENKLKISEADRERGLAYFNLSLVHQSMNDIDEAINCLKQALAIEPNNPRYLDTLLEIGIINKDKILALDAYKKLVQVNPENQKLAELKEQIDQL